MGADLITTMLWYKTGEPHEVTHPGGFTYTCTPPLLDWDKGKAKLIELALALPEDEVNSLANDYFPDVLDQLTDWDNEPLDSRRNVLLTALTEALEELQSEIENPGRDMDGRLFDTGIGFFLTGGMSWGDGPTDAYDLITRWNSDIEWGEQVLEAVGFIMQPYAKIGLLPEPTSVPAAVPHS